MNEIMEIALNRNIKKMWHNSYTCSQHFQEKYSEQTPAGSDMYFLNLHHDIMGVVRFSPRRILPGTMPISHFCPTVGCT